MGVWWKVSLRNTIWASAFIYRSWKGREGIFMRSQERFTVCEWERERDEMCKNCVMEEMSPHSVVISHACECVCVCVHIRSSFWHCQVLETFSCPLHVDRGSIKNKCSIGLWNSSVSSRRQDKNNTRRFCCETLLNELWLIHERCTFTGLRAILMSIKLKKRKRERINHIKPD